MNLFQKLLAVLVLGLAPLAGSANAAEIEQFGRGEERAPAVQV